MEQSTIAFTKKIWSQTSQVLETCEVLDPK